MKNKYIFLFLLFFPLFEIHSQITCLPKVGDRFEIINVGVNFRENADINSKVLYKVTNPNETFFIV